jgi:hypothetical protein
MTRQFTFSELAAVARRELSHRRRVYFRLVREHKMQKADADYELEAMEAIAEFFEGKIQPKLL